MRAHVCQDEYGMWFVVLEDAEGGLTVLAHATSQEQAEYEARADADEVVVDSEPWKDFPEGGLAPGYTKPEPRVAR